MTSFGDYFVNIDSDVNFYSEQLENQESRKKYFSCDEFVELSGNSGDFLTMLNFNIRSFHCNSVSFFSTLSQCVYPEIFVFTETWFKRDNCAEIPGYRSFHTCRSTARSGGVSIYVEDRYDSYSIPEFCYADESIEICTVCVHFNGAKNFIFGIYRPYSGTVENFICSLTNILNNRKISNKPSFILGDFNINILDSNHFSENFVNSLHSLHFLPVIDKPTRYSDRSAAPSLLDQIWYNRFSYHDSGIIDLNVTDHCPTFIRLLCETKSKNLSESVKVTFRCFDEICHLKFQRNLDNFDWLSILSSDVNQYTENFISAINDLFCKSFPMKTKIISKSHLNCPWMNGNLKKLVKAKSDYFHLYRLGVISEVQNNSFKNKVNRIIRDSKILYMKSRFLLFRSNVKKTWGLINDLIGRKVSRYSIKLLIVNGVEITDELEIAEIFANHFSRVAVELDQSLPSSSTNPLDYLGSRIIDSLFLNPVSSEEVSKFISDLKTTKTDPNTISTPIFRKFNLNYSHVIADIINLSFSRGIFPILLKHAVISPIFKSGVCTNFLNYRPISLLEILSKVFERCIYVRLLDFAHSHNIISSRQFGFLKGKSTESAVLQILKYIHNSLNSKMFNVNIFIDMRKAFDTVNISVLLRKLDFYGVRGVPNDLLSSYLCDRSMCVKVGGSYSRTWLSNIGIPQGSILGPLLFLFYINDLPKISNSCLTTLFADDTAFSLSSLNQGEVLNSCNNVTQAFVEWSQSNRMSINTEKTFYMSFTNKPISDNFNIILNGTIIDCKSSEKYLGLILDNSLSFKPHIEYVCSKVSKALGIIYRSRDFLPKSVLVSLYYSLVYPYLNYCILAWGNTFDSHLQPLRILQKKIIRIILFKSFGSPSSPLFHELKLLKLDDIYVYRVALLMFNERSRDIYNRNHSYNTRNRNSLRPAYHRLTSTQHSVSYSGPSVWNSLPNYITNSNNIDSFKRLLKKHLISLYV